MAKSFNKIEVFPGKSIADILQEAYQKTNDKDASIKKLIKSMAELAGDNAASAALLAPLIVEYYEVGVKNDDVLLKIANIVQRFSKDESSEKDSSMSLLSEAEKVELLKNAEHLSVRKKVV